MFIDIKEAFDTIYHNILLKTLQFLGVRSIANSWLTSYLNKRMQYVEVYDCMSYLFQVKCGVPQGSVPGPLLFIYILMISVMYQKYLILVLLTIKKKFC